MHVGSHADTFHHAPPSPDSAAIVGFAKLSGLGPIQKRIRRAFLAHPDRLFRTVELARWAYPRLTAQSHVAPPGKTEVRQLETAQIDDIVISALEAGDRILTGPSLESVVIEGMSCHGDDLVADSDEGGQLFRLKADSVSDRLRTPFR